MKLNFSFLKKGKTIYWIVGAVVLFVVFYLIASRGSSSENVGGITTITAGPSDAQVAAATQLAMANIQASIASNQTAAELAALKEQSARDVALGALQQTIDLANTEAGKTVALANFNAQKEIAALQGEYDVATARVASETEIKSNQIQADMFASQLEANRQMFADQVSALNTQALIGQIGNLKKKNRDEALKYLSNQV